MGNNSERDFQQTVKRLDIVGVHTGPSTYLDHLGVLCALLEIPLIVTEERTYTLGKEFYPQLDIVLKEPIDLSLHTLSQFDAIIESGHFWAMELVPLIELLFGKKLRVVYCPHGNSDKGHSATLAYPKDISLVYGKQMLDLIQPTQILNGTVITGNFRYQFYRQHQQFYDAFIPPKKRPLLLYAPTWPNQENPSNFFEMCERVIEELQTDFDLIVKLHPFLEELYPAQTYALMSRYENFFLTDFPPIYPLLNACDAYLGDFSSIGYDFLPFDKPMFFLQENRGALKECGIVIPSASSLLNFLKENWDQRSLSSIRRQVYKRAFGEERPIELIKKELAYSLGF
jgi:hypothetical protein